MNIRMYLYHISNKILHQNLEKPQPQASTLTKALFKSQYLKTPPKSKRCLTKQNHTPIFIVLQLQLIRPMNT